MENDTNNFGPIPIEFKDKYTIAKQLTLENLKDDRVNMIDYLERKTRSEDWHAVADAAMDLREIDAKISILQKSFD